MILAMKISMFVILAILVGIIIAAGLAAWSAGSVAGVGMCAAWLLLIANGIGFAYLVTRDRS